MPICGVSKLQTETALYSMEADIIAMSHYCRELFPIINISTSLGGAVVLPMVGTTMIFSVNKDNAGALILDRTFPTKITPCSKYYATTNIWFHEETSKCSINILKIDTIEHLGDLFTNGLPRTTFEYLRKKIIGWYISQIDKIHPQEGVLRLSF